MIEFAAITPDGQDALFEIRFRQVNPGYRGSRWEPPEPPEIDVEDVRLVELDGVADPARDQALEDWILEEHRDELEELMHKVNEDYQNAMAEDWTEREVEWKMEEDRA